MVNVLLAMFLGVFFTELIELIKTYMVNKAFEGFFGTKPPRVANSFLTRLKLLRERKKNVFVIQSIYYQVVSRLLSYSVIAYLAFNFLLKTSETKKIIPLALSIYMVAVVFDNLKIKANEKLNL